MKYLTNLEKEKAREKRLKNLEKKHLSYKRHGNSKTVLQLPQLVCFWHGAVGLGENYPTDDGLEEKVKRYLHHLRDLRLMG